MSKQDFLVTLSIIAPIITFVLDIIFKFLELKSKRDKEEKKSSQYKNKTIKLLVDSFIFI